jgi:16S rRNA (guanine1207-N2)-methyltransferase
MPAGHYFDADPTSPSRPATVTLALPDLRASFVTDRGVFSAGRIDPGTVALLRVAPPPPPVGDLLDLGCGYGPIACTLARRSPRATVWAVDVNHRALDLTRANAAALGCANVVAVAPDDVPGDVRFAGLWSNPPVRIGNHALHAMLGTWLARLRDAAPAWLVVHKHLGGDSLAAWLRVSGWAVERRASKQGYRILEVVRP